MRSLWTTLDRLSALHSKVLWVVQMYSSCIAGLQNMAKGFSDVLRYSNDEWIALGIKDYYYYFLIKYTFQNKDHYSVSADWSSSLSLQLYFFVS